MLTDTLRWLRGEVRVRAACRNPARVLNFCAARGITFRNPQTVQPDGAVSEYPGQSPGHAGASPGHAGASTGHAGASPGHAGASPGHAGASTGHAGASTGHAGASTGHAGASTGHAGASTGQPTSRGAVDLSLSRRDWVRLRKAAGRGLPDCAFTVLDNTGAPFLLSRLRRRPALSVTLTLSAFALFLASFFIWDFDVAGNRTVPEEEILRALERQGVGMGSFGLSLNGQDLRNHVLLDIPELVWMTVNVSGCRAKVQVVERVEPPEILNEAVPANLAARRAGLVLEVRALDGQARVVRGMSVDEGDLLVSGTEELGTLSGGVRTMAAHGSVKARTWHKLTASVPLSGMEKRETGEARTGYSLIVGRHRFPLYRSGRVSGAARYGTGNHERVETGSGLRYDKATERTRWTALGVALPVTLERETYRFYETVPIERSPAAAKARAEAALRSYLDAEVSPYGEVRSVLCTARRRGDVLDVTLAAECVEEIAVTIPLAGEDG